MYSSKIVSFISILCILFFSCIKDDNHEKTDNYVNIGNQVPSFAVEDTTGKTFNSKQFLNKQSLLVFFGTHCHDCKKVLPVIEEVWREMKNESKFMLVTISREETAETVSEFWEKNQYTMPFYLDPTCGDVFSIFANNTIPRIYIINQNKEVVWMAIESLDISAKELIQLIKELE